MLKSIIPTLLIAGAAISTSAFAAEPASQDLLGFEFGVGFGLYQDSRIEGINANMGVVLPIGQKFEIEVYHEVGKATFKDTVGGVTVRSNTDFGVNELRFRLTAWQSDAQEVKFLLGIGYFDNSIRVTQPVTTTISQSGNVADLGIDYTVVKAKSGPVKGQLAINAIYRFARANDISNLGLGGMRPVGDYSGVIIGATAGLYF